MNARVYSIHHVNLPIKDADRTKEWYEKVLGLKEFVRPFFQGGAPGVEDGHIFLMTRGNFGVHFTIYDNPPDIKPHHFAVEVEDWDGFVAHLAELGIEYFNYNERPQNGARQAYIHDPDQNLIEFMFHPAWNHTPVDQPE